MPCPTQWRRIRLFSNCDPNIGIESFEGRKRSWSDRWSSGALKDTRGLVTDRRVEHADRAEGTGKFGNVGGGRFQLARDRSAIHRARAAGRNKDKTARIVSCSALIFCAAWSSCCSMILIMSGSRGRDG